MKHEHVFDLDHSCALPQQGDAANPNARRELETRWEAVCHAAQAAAALAGIPQTAEAETAFLARLASADGERRNIVAIAIDDLALVMQIGLTALVGVQEQGSDPGPAAETLWHEFEAARNALESMLEAG